MAAIYYGQIHLVGQFQQHAETRDEPEMIHILQYHPQLAMQREPVVLDQGPLLRSLGEFSSVIGNPAIARDADPSSRDTK